MDSASLCLFIGELRSLIFKLVIERCVNCSNCVIDFWYCLCSQQSLCFSNYSFVCFVFVVSQLLIPLFSLKQCVLYFLQVWSVEYNILSLFISWKVFFLLLLYQIVLLGTSEQVCSHSILDYRMHCFRLFRLLMLPLINQPLFWWVFLLYVTCLFLLQLFSDFSMFCMLGVLTMILQQGASFLVFYLVFYVLFVFLYVCLNLWKSFLCFC